MTGLPLSKLLKGDGETGGQDVETQKRKEAKNGALNTLVCPAQSLKDAGTDFSPQHKQAAK